MTDADQSKVFEAAGLLEAGPLEAEFEPPVVNLRLISSVSMICRKDVRSRARSTCVRERPSTAGC